MKTAPAKTEGTISAKGRAAIERRIRQSRTDRTWQAYSTDWADFEKWCDAEGHQALPASAETVALYLEHLHQQGRRPSTLSRRLAAISVRHKGGGSPSPCSTEVVRSVLAGIRREAGADQRRAAPLRLRDIRMALESFDDSPRGLRDRAIILLGYAGGFRRSELAALNVEDLAERPEGLAITIRRSKTDQEGRGLLKGIPRGSNPQTCPVRALRAWLDASGIEEGPVFRRIDKGGRLGPNAITPQSIRNLIRETAEAAGLDPEQFSGHSLRAGFVTDGYASGAAEAAIMAQTGHRSREVLSVYRREADLFQNAASMLGL